MIVSNEIFTVLNTRIEELESKKDSVNDEISKFYIIGGVNELRLFKKWLEQNWEPEW